MIATPASVERVEKCVFNFETYRFLKKTANLLHPALPTVPQSAENIHILPIYLSNRNKLSLIFETR